MSAQASSVRPAGPFLQRIRAICFGWYSFFWTGFCFVFGCLALLPAPRSGRLSYRVFKIWARGFLAGFGGGVRVEHADRVDRKVPRLIVANHTSWLDPPALIVALPTELRFILKRELLTVPFVGWYTHVAGHYLLDREDPRAAKRLMQKAVDNIHRFAYSPIIYPEGTRSDDGKLAELKPGAFQMAIDAGIEVQPVAILGSSSMMPRGTNSPRHAGDMIIRVGEPISTEGLKGGRGRRALADKATEALLALGVPPSTGSGPDGPSTNSEPPAPGDDAAGSA